MMSLDDVITDTQGDQAIDDRLCREHCFVELITDSRCTVLRCKEQLENSLEVAPTAFATV